MGATATDLLTTLFQTELAGGFYPAYEATIPPGGPSGITFGRVQQSLSRWNPSQQEIKESYSCPRDSEAERAISYEIWLFAQREAIGEQE